MEIDLNQQSKKEQSGTAYNLGDFKILVVEDSPFIANLLGSCLMEMGVGSVIKAGNVRDAKDKILSNNAMTTTVLEDNSPPEDVSFVTANFIEDPMEGSGNTTITWMDVPGEVGETYRIYISGIMFNITFMKIIQVKKILGISWEKGIIKRKLTIILLH